MPQQRSWTHSLANLASAHLERGDVETALACLKESLDSGVKVGLVDVVSHALGGLAFVAATKGDAEIAVRLVARAKALRSEIGAAQDGFEDARNRRILTIARERLDPQTVAAASAAGTSMSLKDALDVAHGYE